MENTGYQRKFSPSSPKQFRIKPRLAGRRHFKGFSARIGWLHNSFLIPNQVKWDFANNGWAQSLNPFGQLL
jgi:hypothetical protein